MDERDDAWTVTSVGVLGYAAADVAHHVFGHAASCVLAGGHVRLVTSQVVLCTVTGLAVDLAGPLASLLTGFVALAVARWARHGAPATRLLLVMIAAFNLFWFNLQLLYSAASGRDDWAWALKEFHVPAAGRYALIAMGVVGYLLTVTVIARALKDFARPPGRLGRIAILCWTAAGGLALATAAFDLDRGRALREALPQAMGLSSGLLLLARSSKRFASPDADAAVIRFSLAGVLAACLVAAACIAFLGPGFSM